MKHFQNTKLYPSVKEEHQKKNIQFKCLAHSTQSANAGLQGRGKGHGKKATPHSLQVRQKSDTKTRQKASATD